MFSFAHTGYFMLLLILPAVFLLYLAARGARKRKLGRYGRSEVIARLMPNLSTKRHILKLVLELLLITTIVVMVARPRMGTRKVSQKASGIEVVVAVDVSNSMNASSTNNPQDISRMQQAKFLLEKLIDRLDGNKVGLVVFAGNPYMQSPMTIDAQSTKMYINDISTGMAATQGTAIGAAIKMSAGMFSQKTQAQKAIIIITDAENFEDDAVESASEAYKNDGIHVSVVGVGSPEGSFIIDSDGERFLDDTGNEVVTKLNEQAAADIAKAGKGIYVNGRDTDALDALEENLSKLADSSLGQYTFTRAGEQFPIFAVIALILLIALIMLRMKKNAWLSSKFKWLTVMLICISVATSSCNGDDKAKALVKNEKTPLELELQHEFDTVMLNHSNKDERNFIDAGNRLYNDSNYVDAEVQYRKAVEANENSFVGRYNLAATLIRQGIASQNNDLFMQADSVLKYVIDQVDATDFEHHRLIKNHAFHNLGNLYYAGEQWDEAIELFKMALRYNPDDNDARYNLRMAQLKKKQQEKQQNKQQQKQDQQDQQNQDNDQKKDQDQNNNQNQDQNQNGKNKDKQQQVKQQQQAEQRHPQNNDAKRDKEVLQKVNLKPQEQKQDQQKDQRQDKKQDEKKDQKKDEKKDNNDNQNQPPRNNQQKINPQNAQQIINTMNQRERETARKIKEREEQMKAGERMRTQNKW